MGDENDEEVCIYLISKYTFQKKRNWKERRYKDNIAKGEEKVCVCVCVWKQQNFVVVEVHACTVLFIPPVSS